MSLRLRYVELRPLGLGITAVGTLNRRWFRMQVPISAAADLIQALPSDRDDPGRAAAEPARRFAEVLLAEGSMVRQRPEPGPQIVTMTGDGSLCERIRRADGSGVLRNAGYPAGSFDGLAVSGGLVVSGGVVVADGLVVAVVDGADPGRLRTIGQRCGTTAAWAPLWFDAGRGWFGPVLRPDGELTLDDLLARVSSTDTSPKAAGPALRLGLWKELPEPELAWIVSTIAALLRRHLEGEDCQLPSHLFELNPATFSVARHLVLPMPLTGAATGPVPVTCKPANLVDERTGIVTRLTKVHHDPSIPSQLKTTHAHVAQMRRVTSWLTDPIAAGTSFTSWKQARQAAIGEAVERYCGNIVNPARLRLATWQKLAADGEYAVVPEELVLFSGRQYASRGFPFVPMTSDLSMHWVRGRSLTRGRPAWLPASLVYANWYTGPYAGTARTNNPFYPGLAAGPTLEFALTAGIQEVVERHITMVWWANAQPLPSVRPTAALAALWRKEGAQAPRAWLIHLDNEFSIPVLAGVVEYPAEGLLTIGFGARPDPEQAAFKAFAEALTLQDGARDLLKPGGGYRQAVGRGEICGDHVKPWRADRRYLDDYRSDFRDVVDLMCQLQVSVDPRAPEHFRSWVDTPQTRGFDDLPVLRDPTLAGYQQAVEEKGYEIFYADVTTHDVARSGMRAVRVLVPGLVPNFAAGLPFQGLGRLRQAAVELGWREAALDEDEINVFPMPHA